MLANAQEEVLAKTDKVLHLELGHITIIHRATGAFHFIAEAGKLDCVRVQEGEVAEGAEPGAVAFVVVITLIAKLAVVEAEIG